MRTSHSLYTAKFKLSITKYTEENGNCTNSHRFGVLETNFQEWKKKKNSVLLFMIAAKFPEIENQLVKYIKEK